MNVKSVKFRLTIWYFLAFFISTTVAFSAFYIVTRQILIQQTDREIALHSAQIEDVVAQGNGTLANTFPKSQLSHQFAEMPGMLVVISDGNGKILTTSQTLDSGTPVVADTLVKSSGIIKPLFVNRNIGAITMRVGVFPVVKNGKASNLVLVAHPTDVIRDSLTRLLEIVTLVAISVGVPAMAGAYVLAKSGLKPITDLAQQLKRISSTNLNEQVVNPQTGDEVEELTDSFNHLLKRLFESFDREKQFIGDVAHELKTPLSTLKSSIEIGISKKRANGEYEKILKNTLVDINNLATITNDVLDLAWAESGEQIRTFETVDLSALVNEVAEITEKLAEAKKIRVYKKIATKIKIQGKRQKLFRAIFNLTNNAVKYTPMRGKINITLTTSGRRMTLEIANSGPGISKEEIGQIFKRFYRGKKATGVNGSGLGLAISKSIIEAHGGNITVSRNPGKLTTFKVELSS